MDEGIERTGGETSVKYPRPLRRVVVYTPYDTTRKKKKSPGTAPQGPAEHVVELVCNHFKWEAETVSELYLSRWRIEIFFKLIKQDLRNRSRYNWHMSICEST